MRPKLVGLAIAIHAMSMRMYEATVETKQLNNSLIVVKPKKQQKAKHHKHNKSKIKVNSFKSKLTCKPNSVKKNFNSRRV